ncbi:MAG: putative membrane protein/thiol-disulfide isomerase/thioredoxin [Verrucomicrobiales bacterium]|jgi:uncharacterized membrane protein/thiol-disulfide isomerase/thioredoxin
MAARKKSKKQATSKAATKVEPAVVPSPKPPAGNSALLNVGRVLLFAASVIALYLTVTALSQGQVAGCEEGESCNTVLASKWAKLFGLPIGAFGAVAYLALLGTSFVRGLQGVQWFLTISIIGGALWFTGVQAFALKTFCPWCCSTHALAVLGTILLMTGVPRSVNPFSSSLFPAGAALAALAVTAFMQIKAPDPQPVAVATKTEVAPVEVKKEKRASLTLHDQYELSTVELPSMGDAETAEHVAVGIFDFSCSHCRHLMKVLKPVAKEYGDQLAIIKLPGHYNQNGREIQKLMLPVFREAPEVYEALGNDLYAEKIPAVAVGVRQELEKRLGAERLEQILAAYGSWAEERVEECKQIIETNRKITKSGKLPQMMVGKSIETGNKTNPGHYHKMFADNFGLTREKAPELACSPASLDLGTVVAFSEHELTLTLSNPGKLPVTIAEIKRFKGINVENVPKSLAPGASQAVTIKLTVPGQQKGKVATYFEVHSDAGEPVIKIPFTANVVGVKFNPPILNFGVVEAGGPPKAMRSTLTLELPAKITGTSSPIRFFKSDPVEVVEENKVYKVRVTAQFEAGIVGIRNSYANFIIEPLDDSVAWPKQIRIPIKARVIAKKKAK